MRTLRLVTRAAARVHELGSHTRICRLQDNCKSHSQSDSRNIHDQRELCCSASSRLIRNTEKATILQTTIPDVLEFSHAEILSNANCEEGTSITSTTPGHPGCRSHGNVTLHDHNPVPSCSSPSFQTKGLTAMRTYGVAHPTSLRRHRPFSNIPTKKVSSRH